MGQPRADIIYFFIWAARGKPYKGFPTLQVGRTLLRILVLNKAIATFVKHIVYMQSDRPVPTEHVTIRAVSLASTNAHLDPMALSL